MELINDYDTSKHNKKFSTADLALATAISLSYPLEAIDHRNRKAQFIFKLNAGLDELITSYWRRELKVDPQAYYDAMRVIKGRLYDAGLIHAEPTDIEALRQILKDEYGKDVSQADISEIAHALVGYYDLLAKIYHREKIQNNNDNNDNQRISDEK